MVVSSGSSNDLSSDPALAPFLSASFSPVDYLNSTLPSWTPNSQSTIPSTSTSPASSASLNEITSQTQAIITQLNAQLTRLSASLTGLTDDILRAGGRLAYEVELLRGDAGSLGDALSERLNEHVLKFVPEQASESGAVDGNTTELEPETQTSRALARLHTLTIVRDRLDAVIKVFGDAMAWPVAPSEIVAKSSFISVSVPSEGADSGTLERQGKAFTDKIKVEISELLSTGTDEGELEALRRLEALRLLATVWKGTSEEKARLKIIDSLASLVEERKRSGATPGRSGYGLGSAIPLRAGQARR